MKNVLIGLLIWLSIVSIGLAVRNAKPICHDIMRNGEGLVCVYNLGDIQEDDADVIIAK
jgi:hypothetical protein